HLLSQRSGHNSGALDVPKVNREIQPRRVFWRVNKAATERARIFRLKIRVASYKGVRFRFEQAIFERIVSNLQRRDWRSKQFLKRRLTKAFAPSRAQGQLLVKRLP